MAPNKSGYNNVKTHVITGSTDGALTDYQMFFVIHRGTGTDNGQDVYLNDDPLSWPNDIRFTNNAGTQLDYWIEGYDADTAKIWVEIDSIPINPNTATIKIYYGKAGDLGASNGFNTFMMFEDFSDDARRTTVWNEGSGGVMQDVHKFENGGYHLAQYSKAQTVCAIVLRNSLGKPSVCNVTLDIISEAGDRTPAWADYFFGTDQSAGTHIGYAGSVRHYDVLPGHSYQISWTDGTNQNNVVLYENSAVINKYSFDFALTYMPYLAAGTYYDSMSECYYRNFYARAYTANPPIHGIVKTPSETQRLWDAIGDLQNQINTLLGTINDLQTQLTGLGTRVTATEQKNAAQDANDVDIQTNLAAETTARTNADTNLQTQIDGAKSNIKIITGVATPDNNIIYPPDGYTVDQCQIFTSIRHVGYGNIFFPMDNITCYSTAVPEEAPTHWEILCEARTGKDVFGGEANYMIIAQK